MNILQQINKEPYMQLKPIEWYSQQDEFSHTYNVEKYKGFGRWREAPIVITKAGEIVVYKTLSTGRIYPLSRIRSIKACVHDADGDCVIRLKTNDGKLIKLRDRLLPGPIFQFLEPLLAQRAREKRDSEQSNASSDDWSEQRNSGADEFSSIASLSDHEQGAVVRSGFEAEEFEQKQSEAHVDEHKTDSQKVKGEGEKQKPASDTTSAKIDAILDDLYTRFSEDDLTTSQLERLPSTARADEP